MRKGSGIAGATMLFGPRDKAPDLVQAMQYLLDDLRSEGRRIAAIKLTPSTLRLRTDPYELVLTVAEAPLPFTSMQGLLRPPMGEAPDFARVHLGRTLRIHRHAMGFLLRRRGAPILDLDEAMRTLAEEGRFCLLPVIEATAPSMLVWQPGGLVLTTEEFRRAGVDLLLQPGDARVPLTPPRSDRLALPRPGASALMTDASPPDPVTRQDRADAASLGRLFGRREPPGRAPLLPRLDRASDRVTAALRDTGPEQKHANRRAASLWTSLLPALTGLGGVG
ncbi:hypothetical protein [Pararhodobacter aggregans]|uniref:Uncharacterized protein n=1 Tax=Pararhodobacter aggregans TaxID=404875 RepID=A0A2T7UXI2_9RHOB|nr:hypothetical protein [Pararhodobacter aggregans]PTX05201.1 hypothetical protein C8N33_101617 [Pararhodobacter aggregans]PVE49500.1 hypothetical protein DDE23_03635 [Pararhodobacter aggregans]